MREASRGGSAGAVKSSRQGREKPARLSFLICHGAEAGPASQGSKHAPMALGVGRGGQGP